MGELVKKEIIQQLREKICTWEGFKRSTTNDKKSDFGLDMMDSAFPHGTFPLGAIHEFVSPTAASAAASNGFISGVLATLMRDGGMYCLWVSTRRSLFPPALQYFGIAPHQVIFVDVRQDKEALWVMEQSLRSTALVAVVAELTEINFVQSQRLQLAVETSKVTGFLHRKRPQRTGPLACASRWRIKPAASYTPDGLPGVGYPVWDVQLEKIRNGKPGKWQIGWQNNRFINIERNKATKSITSAKERYA